MSYHTAYRSLGPVRGDLVWWVAKDSSLEALPLKRKRGTVVYADALKCMTCIANSDSFSMFHFHVRPDGLWQLDEADKLTDDYLLRSDES